MTEETTTPNTRDQFLLDETLGEKLYATRLTDGFILHYVNLASPTVNVVALSDEQIYFLSRYGAVERQAIEEESIDNGEDSKTQG